MWSPNGSVGVQVFPTILSNSYSYSLPDDPLNTVIQRMQTLSSVTNAVALQIGLLADTIPHYDVIAELLHFDHVKSSDFKNPIANDVETMLNRIDNLVSDSDSLGVMKENAWKLLQKEYLVSRSYDLIVEKFMNAKITE